MVPGGRPLIPIGYNYNARKVLYFIVTEKAGITQAGLTYLYKYTDQFNNVAIFPVACTLFVSKFFGEVNEADSHNKLSQSNLELEKLWVAQCDWIWLCMKVSMGMTITKCCLFFYGVKRDHN